MQTTAYTHDGKATMVIEGPIQPERIVDVPTPDEELGAILALAAPEREMGNE